MRERGGIVEYHNGGSKKNQATLLKMEGTLDGMLLFQSFFKEPPSERFRESLSCYPERRDCENFHSEERRG
jgi:hypothetical protein